MSYWSCHYITWATEILWIVFSIVHVFGTDPFVTILMVWIFHSNSWHIIESSLRFVKCRLVDFKLINYIPKFKVLLIAYYLIKNKHLKLNLTPIYAFEILQIKSPLANQRFLTISYRILKGSINEVHLQRYHHQLS